jgi:DNA-binding transcriptional regulator YdaS (Cro superfamily)
MQHLQELNFLIDAASTIAGNDSKLALMLDVPKQHVSAWRKGKKTATPEDQAILAGVAGLDPLQTLARASVQKWEGTPKGERLMSFLGKPSLAIGAALASAGASAATKATESPRWKLVTIIAKKIQDDLRRFGKANGRYVKGFLA